MSDAIVVEQRADADWHIHLHVMANSPEALESHRVMVPAWADVQVESDKMRMHHLRASWPIRGEVSLQMQLGLWPMIAWWIGDDRVSAAIKAGGDAFRLVFGLEPMFAFIRHIPPKASELVEVDGITLVCADWVPSHFLALARGGMIQLNGGKNG